VTKAGPFRSVTTPTGARSTRLADGSITRLSSPRVGLRMSNTKTRSLRSPVATTMPSVRIMSFTPCGSLPRLPTGMVASTRP
jgi:hypothetical protein